MIPAVILCVMAILDTTFAGFRAIAGRDAHLDTARLFGRWMVRGAAAGVLALGLIGLLLGALLVAAPAPGVRYEDMVAAGTRMLVVFVPYTAVVLLALGAYAVPVLDVRALATTLVLGPLTLARPAVLLLGAVAAAWGASPPIRVAAFTTVAIVLGVEAVLQVWARPTPPAGLPSSDRQ